MHNVTKESKMSAPTTGTNHRTVTGYVTKVLGDQASYGFINEEIFFQQFNVVAGPACIGDQVYCECEYSSNLPIKWNATSVKILNKARQQQNPSNDEHQQPQQPADHQADLNNRLITGHNGTEFYNMQQQNSVNQSNLAFTSQPGSAFVSQHFIPPQFVHQNQQQMQQKQQSPCVSHNQQGKHDFQSRSQKQGNFNQKQSGRWNEGGRDRNDRFYQDRNSNKKFDNPRRQDRDNSRNNDNKVNRQTLKRDPSPSSSARSTTSNVSDRINKGRRHYQTQNLPTKSHLLSNLNPTNIKQRCSVAIHCPSDLKEVLINDRFRLDIINIPKPINFNFSKKEETNVRKEEENINTEEADNSKKQDCGKTEIRLNHKYGVKIVLLSLPKIKELYQRMFGEKLDSYTGSDKNDDASHLNDLVSLLCNKANNGGYSLVGGKFDPAVDGFLEGLENPYERDEKQPNLVATCIRVVKEHTGLDLSRCTGWNLVSTFIYNNKNDHFTEKASVEYSSVYLPQIWTLLEEDFGKNLAEYNTIESQGETQNIQSSEEEQQAEKLESKEAESKEEKDVEKDVEKVDGEKQHQRGDDKPMDFSIPNTDDLVTSSLTLGNLSDMKVFELKAELDRRGIKHKSNAKKAELVHLMNESITDKEASMVSSAGDNIQQEKEAEHGNQGQEIKDEALSAEKLEENIVEAQEDPPSQQSPTSASVKRPIDESGSDHENGNKKKPPDDISKLELPAFELVSKSLNVHGKDNQLSIISLNEGSQASKHDQFELSVASNILKESIAQHFSEYIFSALIENWKKKGSANQSNSSTSSQDNSSDTNNNNNKTSFKNPRNSIEVDEIAPIDRHINIAFSYFDTNHTGYLFTEDLSKLFNFSGLTISKKALTSLLGGDNEKFHYLKMKDLPEFHSSKPYKFPDQFEHVVGSVRSKPSSNQAEAVPSGKMVEYNGDFYDIEKLVERLEEAERNKITMIDKFNYAIENGDKLLEEIHLRKINQESLAKAIKSNQDELNEIKKERDSIKRQYESARKLIKSNADSFKEFLESNKKS